MLTTALLTLALIGSPANANLSAFNSALYKAQDFNASFKVTEVGGGVADYSVSFSKPNKARVETPEKIMVADGTNITVFMKSSNSFYKKAQDNLKDFFDDVNVSVWASFFNDKAMDGIFNAKDDADKTIKGEKYKVVKGAGDQKGDMQVTFYLNSTDKVARKVEFLFKGASKDRNFILNTDSLNFTAAGGDMYAFKAPAGSKEISEADLMASGKWYHNLDEAAKIAAATNKLIMVDFDATWCGPCKMMKAEVFPTARFKELAKNFVLCEIDIDENKGLAAKYGVSAIPNVKFMNKNLTVVHEFLGYGGPEGVYKEMETAKSKG